MKLVRTLPLRTKILLLALFLLGGVYIFSLVQTSTGERELESAAQKEIDSIHNADNDIACEVTVSRPWVLFGEPRGKVDVFVRPRNTGANPPIHVVSFYYVREHGVWQTNGSGASASEESHQKGLQVFAYRNAAALPMSRQQAP